MALLRYGIVSMVLIGSLNTACSQLDAIAQ
jgi:hypothetical protein